MIWITTILNKIKLVPVLIGTIILLLVGGYWQYDRASNFKKENNRQKANYESVITAKDTKLTNLRLKNTAELNVYLEANAKLNNLVDDLSLKAKQIKTITHYEEVYIDSSTNNIDVSPVISDIKNNIPSVTPWRDSTECLVVDGVIRYKEDKLSVEVLNREYKNDIVVSGYWYRNPKNIFTRWFGKKIYTIKTISNCDDGQTTVIDIEKH